MYLINMNIDLIELFQAISNKLCYTILPFENVFDNREGGLMARLQVYQEVLKCSYEDFDADAAVGKGCY